jgi:hypothetical protein
MAGSFRDKVRKAKKALTRAEAEHCTCTGFVLQYEGSCQCKRGKEIAACEERLQHLMGVA